MVRQHVEIGSYLGRMVSLGVKIVYSRNKHKFLFPASAAQLHAKGLVAWHANFTNRMIHSVTSHEKDLTMRPEGYISRPGLTSTVADIYVSGLTSCSVPIIGQWDSSSTWNK
jgi:hypothetical protein